MIRIHRATRPRRYWLALLAAGLLPACLPSRAPATTPLPSRSVRIIPPQEGLPGRVDTLNDIGVGQSTERASLFRRLFSKSTMPRKFKGTINYYAPGSTVSTSTIGKKATAAVGEGATSTTTGKKSGPAVIASDSVDQAVAGANAQQVVTRGNGNQVDAKKQDTTQQAKDWKAELASPVGKVVAGVAALILAGTAVYGFLLWRKKKQAETLIS